MRKPWGRAVQWLTTKRHFRYNHKIFLVVLSWLVTVRKWRNRIFERLLGGADRLFYSIGQERKELLLWKRESTPITNWQKSLVSAEMSSRPAQRSRTSMLKFVLPATRSTPASRSSLIPQVETSDSTNDSASNQTNKLIQFGFARNHGSSPNGEFFCF